jgi:hypothetical protein
VHCRTQAYLTSLQHPGITAAWLICVYPSNRPCRWTNERRDLPRQQLIPESSALRPRRPIAQDHFAAMACPRWPVFRANVGQPPASTQHCDESNKTASHGEESRLGQSVCSCQIENCPRGACFHLALVVVVPDSAIRVQAPRSGRWRPRGPAWRAIWLHMGARVTAQDSSW